MADDAQCRIRRAEIAAMLANPAQRMESKSDLAARYNVDLRTIYRDMESREVQEAVQEIIRAYAKSEGLAAAYKVVLGAIAGKIKNKEVTIMEQTRNARWLIEMTGTFDIAFLKEAHDLLTAPADRTESEFSSLIEEIEKLPLDFDINQPGNGHGNGERPDNGHAGDIP